MTFNGEVWDHNGPRTLTNVVTAYCCPRGYLLTNETVLNGLGQCETELDLLPKEYVCPISSEQYLMFYMPTLESTVRWKLRNAFLVHYFNKMRTGVNSQDGSKDVIVMAEEQPLYGLMKDNCPVCEEEILRSMIGGQY